MASAELELGIVKWFNEAKGYGFITPQSPKNKGDIFVHFSVITGSGYKKLDEGQRVMYLAEEGPKGMQATRVDPIEARREETETTE